MMVVFYRPNIHVVAMFILALDTAMSACACVAVDAETLLPLAQISQKMERGHAEAIAPMMAAILNDARVINLRLDRIVATIGPGSFTGLRVGMAAAEGLAIATGAPLVGVSTLQALAAHMGDEASVLALINARHDHVYMAHFSHGACDVAPRYASLDEARKLLTSRTRLVGNGALLLGATKAPTLPDMVALARLGAQMPVSENGLKPLYLKAVDAKPRVAAHV